MAALELAGVAAGPLRDVTLGVADGELLAVVGPGKSTLLAALIGLAEVTAGEVLIGGEVATDWTPASRNLAMVFQDHAPYPHLSVRENLALPLRLARRPLDRVAEVADLLGIGVHLDRMPSQLSGGQRQRVAVGRVLVRVAPAAYLLDEPLSADPGLRPRLHARVAGVTTVWACADPVEAAALGGRIAVLAGGTLAQVGTLPELTAAPATLEVARLAPLNLLPGVAADGGIRTPLGVLPGTAPAGEVLVGIRPADLVEGPGFTVLADPDGTLRHPALTRAAAEDPRLTPTLLATADPAGRRTLTLTATRVLLFDPGTGSALTGSALTG